MFRWLPFVNRILPSVGFQISFQSAIANTLAIILPLTLQGCSNTTDNQTTDARPAQSSGATGVEGFEREKPPVALKETTEPTVEPKEELTKPLPAPQTLSTFQIPVDWKDDERMLMTSLQQWDGESEVKAEGTDPARVVGELERFATNGDLDSSFLLGSLYMNGWIVPEDLDKAAGCLKPALDSGHRGATHVMAVYAYANSSDEKLLQSCFALLQKNGDAGFIPSQVTLASILSFGLKREKDPNAASKWAFRALKSQPENKQAMALLSLTFKEASLTPEEGSELFKFFEERANSGSPEAMHFIGETYAQGIYTEKDPLKAIEWYQKAMEKEFPAAFGSLGNLIQQKSGEQWKDDKITMEQHKENIVLCRTLWAHGAKLGDGGCDIMLELTAPLVDNGRLMGLPYTDYSPEAMMMRAYDDAMLDAAGLERIDR